MFLCFFFPSVYAFSPQHPARPDGRERENTEGVTHRLRQLRYILSLPHLPSSFFLRSVHPSNIIPIISASSYRSKAKFAEAASGFGSSDAASASTLTPRILRVWPNRTIPECLPYHPPRPRSLPPLKHVSDGQKERTSPVSHLLHNAIIEALPQSCQIV